MRVSRLRPTPPRPEPVIPHEWLDGWRRVYGTDRKGETR